MWFCGAMQDEDLVQHNPADRIRKRSTRKRRTRLFTHEELKANWCDRQGTPGQIQARTVIKLAYTGSAPKRVPGYRSACTAELGKAGLDLPHEVISPKG